MKPFAIDPGAGGGIVTAETAYKMPDTPQDLATLIRALYADGFRTCYLEEIPKHAGRNAAAMMKLSRQYGEVRGVLATVGVQVFELKPQAWQKAVGVSPGLEYAKRKRKLKELAQQVYPWAEVTLWNADALMILEAARRIYGCTGTS